MCFPITDHEAKLTGTQNAEQCESVFCAEHNCMNKGQLLYLGSHLRYISNIWRDCWTWASSSGNDYFPMIEEMMERGRTSILPSMCVGPHAWKYQQIGLKLIHQLQIEEEKGHSNGDQLPLGLSIWHLTLAFHQATWTVSTSLVILGTASGRTNAWAGFSPLAPSIFLDVSSVLHCIVEDTIFLFYISALWIFGERAQQICYVNALLCTNTHKHMHTERRGAGIEALSSISWALV